MPADVGGTSAWDGKGLPPVAAERARRAAEGGAWTSMLTAPAAAGLEAVGLDPVGEVMGSMVQHIGWTGSMCTAGYGPSLASPPLSFDAYKPHVDALTRGHRTAMKRMLLEASAIGADGVVGVRLTTRGVQGKTREFTALGTAVRARSRTRPPRVFSTDLSGQDVAKLLTAGWVPVDLVYGISAALRHIGQTTLRQTSWQAGNVEVDAYTQLITRTRASARERFGRRVRDGGAEGAIVSSIQLRTWTEEPSDGHRDSVAEAAVFGTSVARFHRSRTAPTRTLTFLPLT